MEKNYDRATETKTLSGGKYNSYALAYWFSFLVFIILFSHSDGKKRLVNHKFTKGVVVDKVLLPGESRTGKTDIYFSQWQYIVDKDTFLFVDKRFHANKPIGAKGKIIYNVNKHDEALVYNFFFWINLPLLLIALLVAVFIFGIARFIVHWNDREWFKQREY